MASNCFICSIKSAEFDKSGVGFLNHIQKEHNMWSYVYFLMHLKEKDPSDYTAAEQYFFDFIFKKREPQACFPINKSLSLLQTKETGVCMTCNCPHATFMRAFTDR